MSWSFRMIFPLLRVSIHKSTAKNELFAAFLHIWSFRMFRRILSVVFFGFGTLGSGANADEPIVDPTADYLAMNVPDRVSNAGHLLIVKKVEVDLEGNGMNAIFLGTWYRHSGPNTWLWAGYA